MKAFLLKLDDALYKRTRNAANRRWKSVSAFIRDAISQALESGQPTKADGDSSTGDQSEPTSRNESGKEVV